MRVDDVEACERLSAATFYEVDTRTYQRSWPDPAERTPERGVPWRRRTEHLVRTDPGGCWVAEHDDRVVGCAVSFNRELMWLLATFVVAPDLQGHGIGKALLAVAMDHGKGCLRGMLAASNDARAVRRYRQAGFSLHPQLLLWGVVDRTALPVVEHVREATASDVDLMDSLDRRCRGAAHGPDHEVLMSEYRAVITDRPSGSGYAYIAPSGQPGVIAATDRRTAARLLWEALASSPPGEQVVVPHVTAVSEWAVDVGLAARLDLHTFGYLAVRRMKPPTTYLHHGALL